MAYNKRADRAKLFAPYDALKGYREALIAKEKIIVPRKDLSEEVKDDLDIKFRQLHVRDIITVVYYENDQYIKITGMISKIEETSRIIQIVDTRLSFDDICSIEADFL